MKWANPSIRAEIRRRAQAGIHPRMLGVQRSLVEHIVRNTRLRRDRQKTLPGVELDGDALGYFELCAVVRRLLNDALQRYEELRVAERQFARKLATAQSEREVEDFVLEFAEAMGASRRRLAGDRKAFRRWFGVDAVQDRHADEIGNVERMLVFLVERLGTFAARVLAGRAQSREVERLWRYLELEDIVFRLARHEGDRRVPAEAFLALSRAIESMPLEMQLASMSDQALRRLYRACVDRADDVWAQISAITLLLRTAPDTFRSVAKNRFENPGPGADIFVRRAIVRLLEDAIYNVPQAATLLDSVLGDPSPHVRQGIGLACLYAPHEQAIGLLFQLCLKDPDATVRAANLLSITQHVGAAPRVEPLRKMLLEVVTLESDEFALRCAFRAAEQAFHRLQDFHGDKAIEWSQSVQHHLALVHADPARPGAVRRHAARTLERFWCASEPEARKLLEEVRALAAATRPGRSSRMPGRLAQNTDRDVLGRVLAIAAQDGFGLEVWRGIGGWRLGRGEQFRPRLWRILHELRHPASDKRQGHSHVVGRIYRGRIVAPPGGLGELSRTRVPGEPLVIGEEGGWRPYLPLPDHVLSAIDTGRCLRLFTAEGVTEIRPPRGLLRQLATHLRLSRRFARVADLRNWQSDSGEPPDAYVQTLREMGVEVRLRGYGATAPAADPGVTRFFAASPLLLVGEDLLRRFEQYAFSFYQNTLLHLFIFAAGVGSIFFGRHLWSSWEIHRARRAIGLVIGGWGTRGKSGTERLKAAMFNALGYGMVSKTTGCEAMFVMSRPFRPLREMFLFRPYDKATIWEQHKLTVLSTRLQAEVFLWECMGLTPAYVKILQRQWMRDDVSTITNTYPDHEDLQGPAGYDIPRVMINFIPRRGHLVTSEEEMRPILESASERLESGFSAVGWLESGTLAPDVLERFPYAEHPMNIALVLALAQELGIPRDFALKEMADRVVPDLGVLKCYPPATCLGRRIEFINGMSANERFGCLGNWKRMGFAAHDPVTDPGTWLMTVVNNRADREPRSKVFARILARDVQADGHLLIGSNLEGLQSFLREEWSARLASLSLWKDDEGESTASTAVALDNLFLLARRMRLPLGVEEIEHRAWAMCAGLGAVEDHDGEDFDAIGVLAAMNDEAGMVGPDAQAFLQRQCEWLQAFSSLAGALHAAGGEAAVDVRAEVDARLHAFLTDVFFARIHVVEDFYASGNQVIETAVRQVPPGLLGRVMGIQNIKGTGLDFVYRWQAWERCHRFCEILLEGRPEEVVEALRGLAAFAEFSPVMEVHVRETLAAFRTQKQAQNEMAQVQIGIIEENLQRQVAAVRHELDQRQPDPGRGAGHARWLQWLVDGLEQFLDSGDAVRRRKRADLVYRELAAQRISQDRAIRELQGLNKRQKGGWLRQKLLAGG